jgi:hypothetical protein
VNGERWPQSVPRRLGALTLSSRGFLYNLRRNLASLLNPEAVPMPMRGQPFGAAPLPQRTAVSHDMFGAQLKALLAKSRKLSAGRINFIALNKVKKKLGARWQRVAYAAGAIACEVILNHLLPEDIYIPLRDDAFLIVLATLSERQALKQCLKVADEITRALIGDEVMREREVKTAVTRLDGTVQIKDAGLVLEEFALELSQAADNEYESVEINDPKTVATPADFRVLYRPMWSPALKTASIFYCAAEVRTGDRQQPYADAELVLRNSPSAKLEHVAARSIMF